MGNHGLYQVGAGVTLNYGYAAMIVLAVTSVCIYNLTKDIHGRSSRIMYYQLMGIAVLAAIAGAKISVLMGDALWPLKPFHNWWELMWSGRSIVGALLFGFLAAELVKPLMGYNLPPNDRFAIILPISIGIGRVGCIFAGCCRGTPYDGPCAMVDHEGVSRHPTQIYEVVFHVVMGFVLWRLYRSNRFKGHLFAIFAVFYGLFRFLTEFIRDTQKAFWGLSAYQWFAIGLLLAGLASLWLRRSRGQTLPVHEGVPA